MRKDIEVLDRWAAYPNYYALILVFIFSLLMVNEILLMWIKDYPPFSHGILNVMYILILLAINNIRNISPLAREIKKLNQKIENKNV